MLGTRREIVTSATGWLVAAESLGAEGGAASGTTAAAGGGTGAGATGDGISPPSTHFANLRFRFRLRLRFRFRLHLRFRFRLYHYHHNAIYSYHFLYILHKYYSGFLIVFRYNLPIADMYNYLLLVLLLLLLHASHQ